MSFSESVEASISFKEFKNRGEKNPHGWGMGFYPDESAQIIKDPIKIDESKLSEFISNYRQIKAKIFIAQRLVNNVV